MSVTTAGAGGRLRRATFGGTRHDPALTGTAQAWGSSAGLRSPRELSRRRSHNTDDHMYKWAFVLGWWAVTMPSAEPAHDPDLALRALADANRRAILTVIRSEPHPVGSIADAVGLSQQTTSHHLGVLRDAGLVTGTRDGTRHLFVVRTDGLEAVRSYLDTFWPSKLAALKAAVESREGNDRG